MFPLLSWLYKRGFAFTRHIVLPPAPLYSLPHVCMPALQVGMAGIMIEDQVAPKRCGHTKGKTVVGREEAYSRVRAACDARYVTLAASVYSCAR